MNITYTEKNGHLYPNLELPEQTELEIGIWGLTHKNYLLKNKKVTYYNLLTSGELTAYLADVDRQATEMLHKLINDIVAKENVTEELKAMDMMEWVGKMNSIWARAREIVFKEIIYN